MNFKLGIDSFANARIKMWLLRDLYEYIVIGGVKEKVAALLSRVSPTLLYKVIRRAKVR